MAVAETAGALDPVLAFGLVGALGVGSQWLAWRLRLPAIVLMLAAGLIVGPVLGILDPAAQFGSMLSPMIAAILPPEDSSVWGGNAGKLWRGLYADEIAAATAWAGGVGIAALIDAAVASRSEPTQGGDQG